MLSALDDLLVGWITFPLTNHLMNRRHVIRKYRSLVRSDFLPADALAALSLGHLKRVLDYADRWCPFYAERFRQAGLEPGRLRSAEELKVLPPLTREELVEHRRAMVDRRLAASVDTAERSSRAPGQPIPWARFRRHRLVRNTSTGSTGAPTVFYEDGSTTAMNWAHELRLKRWFGVKPGAPEARFARVATEFLPGSQVLRLRWRLWHHLILPGMNLTEEGFDLCARQLVRHRPRVLFGITSALTGLADHVQQRGLVGELGRVELVISWAAPLYEHERHRLESVFGCPVTNIYGSREVGHVAQVCPAGRLHVNQEHYLVEIERLPGAGSRGPGEILVTPLFRTPMPFVRYRIGDVGQWAESECPCGRKQPVLEGLVGRSGEVFRTGDGRLIAPNFWCRAFMGPGVSDAVERFQVVLRRDGTIRLRIAPRPSYGQGIESLLRDHLRRNLSPDTPLEFEYVPGIDPQTSGKYQMVVNESSIPGGATTEEN